MGLLIGRAAFLAHEMMVTAIDARQVTKWLQENCTPLLGTDLRGYLDLVLRDMSCFLVECG